MPLEDAVRDSRLAEVMQRLRPPSGQGDATTQEVKDKLRIADKVNNGDYFPLGREHIRNYEAVEQEAKGKGFSTVSLVLDVEGAEPKAIIPTGKGEATVRLTPSDVEGTPKLETDLAQTMIAKKRWVELDSSTAANFDALAAHADANGREHPPARVLLDVYNKKQEADIQVRTGENGVPLVVVNDRAHEWTAEYARQHQFSDAELAAATQPRGMATLWGGANQQAALVELKASGASQELVDYVKESASARGMAEAPPVYISRDIIMAGRTGGAAFTKEGKPYIQLEPDTLLLPLEEQKFIIDHELAHLQRGHPSAEMAVVTHNAFDGGALSAGIGSGCRQGWCVFLPESPRSRQGSRAFFPAEGGADYQNVSFRWQACRGDIPRAR